MAKRSHSRELSVFLVLVGVGHVLCQTPKYVQTGTNYTFNPNLNPPLESILWKYKNDKVVEFEDNVLKWFQFEDQGSLNNQNGVFTLNGLKKRQSGLYESEIQVKGKLQYSKHDIRVIDAVVKPIVTCNIEGNKTSLECSVNPEDKDVTFKWSGPNSKNTPGKTLDITDIPNDDGVTFFCTAVNQVSEVETEFKLKNCYGSAHEYQTTPIVLGVVGVIAVAICSAAGLVIYRRKVGNKSVQQTDPEAVGYKVVQPADTKGSSDQQDPSLNMSNSNNCPKDDEKSPSSITEHGTIDKGTKELEDEDESESPKAGGQEVPESAESGQNAAPTGQQTLLEDKSGKTASNGDIQCDKNQGNIDDKQSEDENGDILKSAKDDDDNAPLINVPDQVAEDNAEDQSQAQDISSQDNEESVL